MKKTDRELFNAFMRRGIVKDYVAVEGHWTFEVIRADGSKELRYAKNTLTAAGLNQLAAGGVTNTTSAFIYLAIGTQTAASSLGSVQGGLGEVSRKAASIAASSNEYMIVTMTWAGAADSLTSVDLRTAGAVNYPNSHASTGVFLNFVNSVATILADSDFLKVQMEVRVGSHNL